MKEFERYAKEEQQENLSMTEIAKEKYHFNDRQRQLLRSYYKNKKTTTTSITIHMTIHKTSRLTAMKDLKDLLKQGFVTSQKTGRNVYYYATDKIAGLFDE